MLHYLRACSGPLAGSIFILGKRTLLGRSGEADIQLAELEVSRRHALILSGEGGRFRIGDLESVNGTFVNGQRVDGQHLEAGAMLQLGKSHFVYGEAASLAQLGQEGGVEGCLKLLSGPAKERTVALSRAFQSAARDLDATLGHQTQALSIGELKEADTVPIQLDVVDVEDPRLAIENWLSRPA